MMPRSAFPRAPVLAVVLLAAGLASCAAPRVGDVLARRGEEIVVCGQLVHVGSPVVLWTDPGGYDAYRVEPRFPDELSAEERAAWTPQAHYHTLRRHLPEPVSAEVARDGWSLARLRDHVDLFVVHYDVSGTSRRCFRTLQDRRHLSVHFMIDLDGTIYQTLDVKERAWHAAEANDRSVGVEIANVGAYDAPDAPALTAWYAADDAGTRVVYPDFVVDPGQRTRDFVPRPARPGLVRGAIHGVTLHQYDFTPQQYASLARLAAALHRVLPRIALDVPRGAGGDVLARALRPEEFEGFSGVLGHFHVTERKVDPGPAFDWERVLAEARRLAGG